MNIGVVLQGVDEPERFVALVRMVEELEYSDLWLTDSSLHARDCYSYLTLAASNSTRLKLGTAVTNPITRHPALTAMAAATVNEIASGRFTLGIGAGDRPLRALGHKPATLQMLRATVETVRALWRGETVNGDFGFELVEARMHMHPQEIPIAIAASGPKTLQLAGELADEVIVLAGLFDAGIQWALEHVRTGAVRAARAMPRINVFAYGAIDDDVDRAVEAARPIAAWFPQTAPIYGELAGLTSHDAERVRAVYQGGEFQEAAAAASFLPTEYVQKMALAGNVEHAAERLRGLAGIGIDTVSVFPLGDDRERTVRSFSAAAQIASTA